MTSTPSILVVGATGNTGAGVIHTLANSIHTSPRFANHRIIGLTRNAHSETARKLASIPNVTMMEQDWTMIDTQWLREQHVQRLFNASHNGVSHSTDESLLLNYALSAGVE
jgi:uncharacterized protein YbjT (DUF2867 family)